MPQTAYAADLLWQTLGARMSKFIEITWDDHARLAGLAAKVEKVHLV